MQQVGVWGKLDEIMFIKHSALCIVNVQKWFHSDNNNENDTDKNNRYLMPHPILVLYF